MQAEIQIKLGEETGNPQYYDKALEILGEHGDRELRAIALLSNADLPFMRTAEDKSTMRKNALKILGKHGDRKLQAYAMTKLGSTGYTDSEHPNEYSWYKDAMKVVRTYTNTMGRSSVYIQILQSIARKALDSRGMSVEQEVDKNLYAEVLVKLARDVCEGGFYDKASLYTRALTMLENDENSELRAEALIGLGKCHLSKDRKRALECFIQALELLRGHESSILKADLMLELGSTRYIDAEHKNRSDWFAAALRAARNNDNILEKAPIYWGIAIMCDPSDTELQKQVKQELKNIWLNVETPPKALGDADRT